MRNRLSHRAVSFVESRRGSHVYSTMRRAIRTVLADLVAAAPRTACNHVDLDQLAQWLGLKHIT